MPVGVVIVAAGRGQRLGGAVPKQALDLGGRPILRWSVERFAARADVREMAVVLPADLLDERAHLVGPTPCPCHCVAGGARRQDSVREGVRALGADIDVVLIHDAARPFVSDEVIDRVIDAVGRTGAALPAARARDTVKRVPAGEVLVGQTIPRDEIWLAQTPQGFSRALLDELMDAAAAGAEFTDEASLAEGAGHPVEVVSGDDGNVKITTVDDLRSARIRAIGPSRVGTGYDIHRLVEGRPLVLAGVTIPFERGPLGHSDGDVICHAVADALFGAAGLGDIGQHFPNNDDRWKDIPGLDLLGEAVRRIEAQGWTVTNVDVSVLLERPRLSPFLGAIREGLTGVLAIGMDGVSVKPRTNEGVDAVGRGEAIAAHAVAMIAQARS